MSDLSGSGRHRVVVVGGGITGLAAAYRLIRSANGRPIDVTVLEASSRLGGELLTEEVGGIPVEAGADSFVVRKPWAVDLCKELGLGGELVVPAASGAFVWTGGRLVPYPRRSAFGIPASVGEVLRWRGLSVAGRVRAATEFLRPQKKDDADESIGAMIGRRMGREASRVLVGPLLAGLHAGDPDRLSVRATFPELIAWEREHESLIRGARAALGVPARADTVPEPLFATVWGGLTRLVDTLEAAIGSARIRRDAPVRALLTTPEGGYLLETGEGRVAADAVIVSTPAFESARLLSGQNGEAAAILRRIPYASTAAVVLVYPEGSDDALRDGTGFVVPPSSGRTVTACTWVSRKWSPRDESHRAVVRCFVGRAGDERALELDDDELIAAVRHDVEAAVPIPGPPVAARVFRWARAMPQYELGHLERLDALGVALAATPGVVLAGSAYRGVGISDCVRQADEASGRVREYLRARPARRSEEVG